MCDWKAGPAPPRHGGLFLVGEQIFKIGDLVRIGTTTGYVTSIDLLSVKLPRNHV